MNNLAKRETWTISFPRNRWTGLAKVGALAIGGYVALKVTFGLIGIAWIVASWLILPTVVVGTVYLIAKKYFRR
ncbi:MAG: hypothetical protein HYT61_02250 [Candidatus Yanofskybacteria bacterium]|nr:hypothetical protein [Candidatus Yanofskybacteria bacterium]